MKEKTNTIKCLCKNKIIKGKNVWIKEYGWIDEWKGGWLVNKPKIASFSKFKLIFALKLEFNVGQFLKKYQNLLI